ncbi:VAC14 protein [Pelomyxa schiedti]|nr:VAC14 protein [Pelomyxa schiedti]
MGDRDAHKGHGGGTSSSTAPSATPSPRMTSSTAATSSSTSSAGGATQSASASSTSTSTTSSGGVGVGGFLSITSMDPSATMVEPRRPSLAASTLGGGAPLTPQQQAQISNAAMLCGISATTVRNLLDKQYEKRRLGALDIENKVKELVESGNAEHIDNLLGCLVDEFVNSTFGNAKKGGMVALASAAIALGPNGKDYLTFLFPPIFKCFYDPDPRIRYYALEAMYNVAKATKESILVYFNELFDACCVLVDDPTEAVNKATNILDTYAKDTVTQACTLNLERFIPLLHMRIVSSRPNVQAFLVSWLVVLNSVPDIDIVKYVAEYLEGLFEFLRTTPKDNPMSNENFTAELSALLNDILKQLQGRKDINFQTLIEILIRFTTCDDAQAKLTALRWVHTFIEYCPVEVLPISAALLSCTFFNIYGNTPHTQDIQTIAFSISAKLIVLAEEAFNPPIGGYVSVILKYIAGDKESTRLTALEWILMLHNKFPHQLEGHFTELFPALLKAMSDQNEEVVRASLVVMGRISSSQEYLQRLMEALVTLFKSDPVLLQKRASFMLQLLSHFIEPHLMYLFLARILEQESNFQFIREVVQMLNLLLLTARELAPLRHSLRHHFSGSCPTHLPELNSAQNSTPSSTPPPSPPPQEVVQLFAALYRCWSHSPVSLVSLCLLCQAYDHAAELIASFADLEITVDLLMELDQLVQLIESPIFVGLRLQLLSYQQYPSLFKCLYGLLMLLPQSPAFVLLKNRLSAASKMASLNSGPIDHTLASEVHTGDLLSFSGFSSELHSSKSGVSSTVNFKPLLDHFLVVQHNHQRATSPPLYSPSLGPITQTPSIPQTSRKSSQSPHPIHSPHSPFVPHEHPSTPNVHRPAPLSRTPPLQQLSTLDLLAMPNPTPQLASSRLSSDYNTLQPSSPSPKKEDSPTAVIESIMPLTLTAAITTPETPAQDSTINTTTPSPPTLSPQQLEVPQQPATNSPPESSNSNCNFTSTDTKNPTALSPLTLQPTISESEAPNQEQHPQAEALNTSPSQPQGNDGAEENKQPETTTTTTLSPPSLPMTDETQQQQQTEPTTAKTD